MFVIGEDHLAHGGDATFVKEHVLGSAESDSFGTEFQGYPGIARRVGVGAYTELADVIGPSHQDTELAGKRRLDHGHAPGEHLAGGTVNGDDVACTQCAPGNRD